MCNNKFKIGNVEVTAWASGVGCKCQPMGMLMDDPNEFTLVTDYEGRYHAICKHCGAEIPMFEENPPYFGTPKEGEPVVDDRYGESEINSYDHFMSSVVVYFDGRHMMYNFDGTDYGKDNDGVQHLFYKHNRRKGDNDVKN